MIKKTVPKWFPKNARSDSGTKSSSHLTKYFYTRFWRYLGKHLESAAKLLAASA